MPYNTRRKSLSLPSLGIHLPGASRARDRPSVSVGEQPPQKKFKRTYSVPVVATTTPPPSPPPEGGINHEGINDDIVSGVIDVLEKTGNRPHTVKELAVLLAPTLEIVENSANPHAIISSRLNAYIKRSFSPSNSCLVAKELITSHPRRIYFYLTTCPSQPIPEHESPVIQPRRSVISPVSDDEEMRRRVQLSPSPEVDLSSPDFDDDACPPSPIESITGYHGHRGILARDRPVNSINPKTALTDTPLEGDEQEFTESAIQLKQRSVSREFEEQRRQKSAKEQEEKEVKHEEGTECEDAAALLGYAHPPTEVDGSMNSFASPIVLLREASAGHDRVDDGNCGKIIKQEPQEDDDAMNNDPEHEMMAKSPTPAAATNNTTATTTATTHNIDTVPFRSWAGDMQSPESIELDELDNLLSEFE
ncbi:hypothetical protein DFH27DRAFT_475132 [Peziza echinospora]|nr:hypothetical protein DFH27DRAFT_475132 [Peziza echinospora]